MFERSAFMSASSSSHRRRMSASSRASIGLPWAPGISPNRSSCRRVRSMKASASPNVIDGAASSSLSTNAVIGIPPSLCADHTGNPARSQSESLAPPVFHDACCASPTRRHKCTGWMARRAQKRCATCALPVIAIAPEMNRYRFVTTAFSCAGNNSLASGVNCATTLQVIAAGTHAGRVCKQSHDCCSLCAQSAIRVTPGSLRYRFVTAAFSSTAKECASTSELIAAGAFSKRAPLAHEQSQTGCASCARLCIESNSLTGHVDCTAASRMIACRKCAKGSQMTCVWCAQAAIQTVPETHDGRVMKCAWSGAIIPSRTGGIADAFSVQRNRAVFVIREQGKCCLLAAQNGRPADAARLPNLRLGEMYAARNCISRPQKLLPVVGRIGYAHH